jgi:hypothetical protein
MIPIVWIWKLCLLRENNKAPKDKYCAKAPNRGNFKSRGTNHEIEFENKLDGCVHPPQWDKNVFQFTSFQCFKQHR